MKISISLEKQKTCRECRPFDVGIQVPSDFDFYVYSAWKLDFHQGIYRLGRVRVDINQSFVSTKLILISGFLVDVWRFQHGEFLLLGRQRNRSNYYRASGFDSLHDLF
jgi:hypothetical protein